MGLHIAVVVSPKEYSSKRRLCFERKTNQKTHNKKCLPPHFHADLNIKHS